jgi:hypothetical protein
MKESLDLRIKAICIASNIVFRKTQKIPCKNLSVG